MALEFRKRTDLGHLKGDAYELTSGKAVVGFVQRANGGPRSMWIWSISDAYRQPVTLGPGNGSANTLEEAMEQATRRWRVWLEWAELEERRE